MRGGLGRIRVMDSSSGKRFFLGGKFYGIYLTEREFDVLRLMRLHRYKEIASLLGLSKRTVEAYVSKIRDKFGSPNKSHLINMLMCEGVIFEVESFEVNELES